VAPVAACSRYQTDVREGEGGVNCYLLPSHRDEDEENGGGTSAAAAAAAVDERMQAVGGRCSGCQGNCLNAQCLRKLDVVG
jgi:hypothetical protein